MGSGALILEAYTMSKLTLESVEEAFQQWREQRSNLSKPIPKQLFVVGFG